MMINKLTQLLPPPASPSDSGKGKTWPLIAGSINFPSDYVDFINTYGSGRIAEFIVIFNPFSKDENLSFFDQYNYILEDLNYLIEADKDYYKYKLYPEDNGLIPVGVTDNGDYIFWVVTSKENSEQWGTAIIPARSPDVEYFECNLVTLIEQILDRSLKARSLPDAFPSQPVSFETL
ncbi:SMI1/KNR4 family protein [Cronobacter turicensis]|nr:SMI1/KNR4 family protein [Cronobacter turicensis]EKY3213551.1 SMI1/KNR4 family protein [Cronobacter turicensis]EKY3217579.1 SMI1/KNR4 family protein [Cronobacter turicensis]